jgi:tetratricopeptide (TPR) repeat protein
MQNSSYKTTDYIFGLSRSVLLFLFLLIVAGLFSQTKREIDSLKNELNTYHSDTTKVNILNKLGFKTSSLNIAESLQYSTQALELARSINFERGILKAYSNIGLTHLHSGVYTSALNYLSKALNLAEKLNDLHQKVIIYNYYHLLYFFIKSNDKAAEYAFKALYLAEKINLDAGVAAIYINIGNMYLEQKNYTKSKEYLMQALEIAKKIKHKKKIAIININLGRICIDEKKYETALEYFYKAMNTYEKLEIYTKLINIYTSIGDILLLQNKYDQVREYYRKSLDLANKLSFDTQISLSCNKLANYYYETGKNDSAYYFADSSYKVIIKLNNYPIICDAALLLYKLNYNDGNFKDACDYLEIYKQMNDSLIAKRNYMALDNLEAQYVIEKYEKKIQLVKMEKTMFGLKSIFIISLIILVSVIIIQRINKRRIQNKKDKEIITLKLLKTRGELDRKKAELKTLTFTIVEKNKKIDNLQNEIKNIGKSDDLDKLDEKKEELRNLKILTEDDWVKFKSIFKDVYSEQTLKIDHLSPNLSEGDKRQLMLIKLGFSINKSAEILGVGYRAIQKARQRLAQKLNLKSSKDISNIISG